MCLDQPGFECLSFISVDDQMDSSECFRHLILLLLVYPAVTKNKANCPIIHHSSYFPPNEPPYFESGYSSIYLKFEEALVKDHDVLEKLRASFISLDTNPIIFTIDSIVVTFTNDQPCRVYAGNPAFRPSWENTWVLRDDCINSYPFPSQLEFRSQALNNLGNEQNNQITTQSIAVLSLIHGSLLSIYVPYYYLPRYPMVEGVNEFTLNLEASNLTCHPSCLLTQCILSELISWIEVYSYSASGIKPQSTWDSNQKGTVKIIHGPFDYNLDYDTYDNDEFIASLKSGLKFMTFTMTESQVAWLGVAEYMIVSLSLALVIAKFFPAVHNQIISRATRLEHQSLYWGTAVVSNIFVNVIFSLGIRGWSIAVAVTIGYDYQIMEFLLPIPEFVVSFIFFVVALMNSLKNRHSADIPIPEGISSIMIRLFFCVWCCSSQRCTTKTLRVLILFGFMSFLYHRIMDAISFAFLLFIEDSRVTVVTFALLYASFIIFLVLFISFSILILFRGAQTNVSHSRQVLNCFGGIFMLISVFISIVLMVIIYMIIVLSLNLKGLTGIVTGLVPSIALSAGSWYIKKRLEKEMRQSDTATGQSQYGTMNDGAREDNSDDRSMLLP